MLSPTAWCSNYWKRETSGHSWLWLPTYWLKLRQRIWGWKGFFFLYQVILIAQIALYPYLPAIFVSPLDGIQCPHRTSEFVFANWPILVCLSVWVHRRMLLMSLPLLPQQCSLYLVHLSWIICEMESMYLCNCCFEGYCFRNLFKTSCTIFEYFPSSFFCKSFIRAKVEQTLNSTNTVKT